MTNTKSTVNWLKPKKPKEDKYKVGDLVKTRESVVYMIVQKDNAWPLKAGSGTLKGVCIWSPTGLDRGGDHFPEVGYYHNNLGENYLSRFQGSIKLEGF